MAIVGNINEGLALGIVRSQNSKLGVGVASTYASQASCPTYCPFKGAGCYAETGYTGFTTKRLNNATKKGTRARDVARAESRAIRKMPARRHLRLHVVGDCRTNESAKIVSRAAADYKRRALLQGIKVSIWSYTHSASRVKRSSWDPAVSILASCETPAQVKEAQANGYATAIVVDHHISDKAYMIDDIKVVPCPEQTGKAASCAECRLCWDSDKLLARKVSIGFASHGILSDKVNQSLATANNR